MPAVAEDDDEPEGGQEVDEGQEVGAQPPGDEPVHDLVGLDRELGFLAGFGPEALHDPDAGDALLHDAGEVRQLLLQLERHRVQPVRERRRGDAEQWQRAEREEREPQFCRTTMITPTSRNVVATVRGRSTTTMLTCWMSLLARAMSWPVCARSWNAKWSFWRWAKSRCGGRSRLGTRCGTRCTGAVRCRSPAPHQPPGSGTSSCAPRSSCPWRRPG